MKRTDPLIKKIHDFLPSGAEYIAHEITEEGVDSNKQHDNKIKIFYFYNGEKRYSIISSHLGREY